MLETDPLAVDVARFEAGVERARAALADGDPRAAVAAVDAALALWRGPALADLDDAPFAAAVARELDELRVAALEERAEAVLALGDPEAAVAGLRQLVRDEPLRERARGQLMLALYRCGRQAEAIEVYEAGRRLLADELGLAPGDALQRLHVDILRQAPELGGTGAGPRAPAPPPRARRRRRAVLAGAALAALAGGVLAGALASGGDDGGPALRGSGVLAIDAGEARIVQATPIDGTPTSVAAADGRAWVLEADGQTIAELAPERPVRTFAVGASPVDLAAAVSGVWVGGGTASRGTQFGGPLISGVAHVPAGASAVRRTVALPPVAGQTASHIQHDRIAATERAIWVVAGDGALVRIDPLSFEVVRVLRLGAVAVAASAREAWVLTRDSTIIPVSERGSRTGVPISIPATTLDSIAVGGGAVWITDPAGERLWRVVPGAQPRIDKLPIGAGASAVAYADGAAWVANPSAGVVERVDADEGRVTDRIRTGGTPRDVAADGDRVWVSVASSASPLAAACGPLRSGGGDPEVLLVSDLPLRVGPQSPVTEMADAIAATVERAGHRAGTHRVGYRSCDDSTAQSGTFDRATCRANARAYAAEPKLVAVVGPYNSPCAQQQMLIAATAPRGPLAMVSPTTTAASVLLRGRRAYARVVAPDDAQGRVAAQELRRMGMRRVFVLEDGESYGGDAAGFFAVAARAAGLEIVGRGRFGAPALARRIRASGADAVYVGGLLDTGAGAVVRRLRAALGAGVVIAGPDGLLPIGRLFDEAGPAARGVLVTTALLPVEALPPGGRRFAADLARALRVRRLHPAALYAAQATQVALDAIARSDGSRASVAKALARTDLDGWIGRVRFTPEGDLRDAPVAVLRAERAGGGSTSNLATEGADVVRVDRGG